MSLTTPPGTITFFTGPMACGKTLELVRHLQIFALQQVPLVCLRPTLDTRTPQVASRSGLLFDAISVDPTNLQQAEELMSPAMVIGIDEFQLFDPNIVPLLIDQLNKGKTILASGLDTDFRGLPFPSAQTLMALPETTINRLKAVCAVCRQFNATRTQRLRHNQPVPKDDPIVLIEGSTEGVTYQARCLAHHVF